ncbi:MAG: biopolymer transporter ExbD [Planctomycetes bacterium]|nr:biopolymer transporter ExbD [Planctomycetota bacterium]
MRRAAAGSGGGRLRARRRERGRANAISGINLTPLFDMLFLLLIFVLVAANFDQRQVIAVDLPAAATAKAAPAAGAEQRMVVTLHANGELAWNGTPVSREEIAEHLRALPELSRLLPLIVEGDAAASLGSGIELLDLCRKLGYRNCVFEVRAKGIREQ